MTEPAPSKLPFAVIGLVLVLIGSAGAYRAYLEATRTAPVRAVRAPEASPASPAPLPSPVPSPATRTTAAPAATGASANREEKIAAAQREVRIDLYGEAWCPSCRAAKQWLDDNGIPYNYRDTSDPANARAMRSLNPRRTIPVIDIEGAILIGFNPRRMHHELRRAAEVRVANAER